MLCQIVIGQPKMCVCECVYVCDRAVRIVIKSVHVAQLSCCYTLFILLNNSLQNIVHFF